MFRLYGITHISAMSRRGMVGQEHGTRGTDMRVSECVSLTQQYSGMRVLTAQEDIMKKAQLNSNYG